MYVYAFVLPTAVHSRASRFIFLSHLHYELMSPAPQSDVGLKIKYALRDPYEYNQEMKPR